MLAGAGLGDDAAFAHPLGEQDLADAGIDLVRPGVVEVLPLEVDPSPAHRFGQPVGPPERARAADIIAQVALELGAEGLILARGAVGLLDLEDERHQGFGDEATAEGAEPSPRIGAAPERIHSLVHVSSLAWGLCLIAQTASPVTGLMTRGPMRGANNREPMISR